MALLIYLIVFDRKLIWPTAKIVFYALLFYVPWLIHVLLSGISYIKYLDSNYSTGDSLSGMVFGNILILLLCISGIIVLVKNYHNTTLRQGFFFVFLSLLFVPIVFISPNRITNGHFIVVATVPAVIFIGLVSKRFFGRVIIFFLLMIYLWITPYLLFTYNNKAKQFDLRPSLFNQFVTGRYEKKPLEPKYSKIFEDIKKNSSPGDTITSDLSEFNFAVIDFKYQIHVANFFASNTSRSTLNLRQPELFHRYQPDLLSSKLILLDLPPSAFSGNHCGKVNPPGYKIECDQWKKLELVSSYMTDGDNDIYMYRNNDAKAIHEKIPRFEFPLWLADFLSVSLLSLVLVGLIKEKHAPD